MDFLYKLYENNYFGIGLFAVISFLVVTFLIVLFFGKKDEKKRTMQNDDVISTTKSEDLFKETSESIPLETKVPIEPVIENVTPVMPVVEPISPVTPIINNEMNDIKPVPPISYEIPTEPTPIVSPVIQETEPVIAPVIPETVEPIRVEPTVYSIPEEPKVMEPIKINIPEEPVLTPVEPVINETYYKPVEEIKPESEEIKVPNIDFDALAASISKELDELEKSNNEVKVTPMEEIKPTNTFSSVYVNDTVKVETPNPTFDLPTRKEEVKPENYNI